MVIDLVLVKRMRTWTAHIIAFLLGAAIALLTAQVFWMRAFRAAIPSALQSMEDKQEIRCLVSLTALNRLEKGDQDQAKSFLASEVADYYQHPIGSASSARRKKILPYIEALRSESTALDKELSRKSQ